MTNEDVGEKIIRIETDNLKKGFNFFLRNGSKLAVKSAKGIKNAHHKHKTTGKQSYKQMYKSGQGLSTLDMPSKSEVKLLQKYANKYKMDFAVKKDRKKGNYVLYFKAKDKEIFDKVVEKYKEKMEKGKSADKTAEKGEHSHSTSESEKNPTEEKKKSLIVKLEKAKNIVNEKKGEKVKNKAVGMEI